MSSRVEPMCGGASEVHTAMAEAAEGVVVPRRRGTDSAHTQNLNYPSLRGVIVVMPPSLQSLARLGVVRLGCRLDFARIPTQFLNTILFGGEAPGLFLSP